MVDCIELVDQYSFQQITVFFIVFKIIGSGTSKFQAMGFQIFYGKVSHTLLWAGLRDALAKIAVNLIANCFNCCSVFVVYTYIFDTCRGLDTLVLGNLLSSVLFWDVNVSQNLATVRLSVHMFLYALKM
jgi:hypothetical protein